MKHLHRKNKYQSGFKELQDMSIKAGLPADIIALRIMKQRRPEIAAYVAKNGQMPKDSLPELALQAAMVHESKVAAKMNEGIPSYDIAENAVFAEEQQEYDSAAFDDSYQDFAPALLAVVGTVAKAGINAVNAKREEKGKKPILSGKFWQFLKSKTENVDVSTDGDKLVIGIDGKPRKATDSELAAGLAGSMEEIERQKKKEFLKRNLPFIIAGVVLLIVVVYFIAKKK